MTKFKDLELSDEKIGGGEEDFEQAPEQGSFEPPLPEGSFLVELPPGSDIEDNVNVMNTQRGQRVFVVFGNNCPLTVVQAQGDEDGELAGRVWRGILNNAERNRARRGQPESLWSDWDYVLKALGEKAKPKSNLEYIKKLVAHGGEEFVFDNEYTAYCNPNKVKYIESDDGPNIPDPEGGMGCGNRYYSRDIPVEGGVKQTRFLCKNPECGASLLVNNQMNRIRPANKEE